MSTLDTWDGLDIDPDALREPFGHLTPTTYSAQTWPLFFAYAAAALGELAALIAAFSLQDFYEARVASSSTSVTLATGAKTFTVETGKGFIIGMMVQIYADAGGAAYGTVTSYNSATGELIVNVAAVPTGGTRSSWRIAHGAGH